MFNLYTLYENDINYSITVNCILKILQILLYISGVCIIIFYKNAHFHE
jgi:hypothetical protein